MNKGDSDSIEDCRKQFFEAAKSNDIDKIRMLIKENKMEVDARDPDDENRTALHVAAKNGHQQLLRVLVDEFKANINIEDMFGEVPVHIAADNDHLEMVRFLVAKGSKYAADVRHLLTASTKQDMPMVVEAQ